MKLARRFAGPLGVLGTAALVVGAAHAAGLRLNLTPSVPRGVYLFNRGIPGSGDLVAACVPAEAAALGRRRGYLGPGACAGDSAPVLKFVAAGAGDVVEIGSEVRVNGVHLQPAPPLEDRDGRPLEHYPSGHYELGHGQVWLYSPSAYSWDSRYFGPVPTENVLGAVRPVWTLSNRSFLSGHRAEIHLPNTSFHHSITESVAAESSITIPTKTTDKSNRRAWYASGRHSRTSTSAPKPTA